MNACMYDMYVRMFIDCIYNYVCISNIHHKSISVTGTLEQISAR